MGDSFVARYYATRCPLLLRSTNMGLVKAKSWTREKLVQQAGETQLEVAAMPYSDEFGEHAILTTLKQFLEVGINTCAPSGLPYYFFTWVDDKLPLLLRMISAELDDLPARLPSPFQQFHA